MSTYCDINNLNKIKNIEREIRRINKIVSNVDYNPLDIFGLELPFSKSNLRKEYFRIIRLIHPDKTYNNERFNNIFTMVNMNYRLLHDPQKTSICVKAKKIETNGTATSEKSQMKKNKNIKNLIKQLYSQNNNNTSTLVSNHFDNIHLDTNKKTTSDLIIENGSVSNDLSTRYEDLTTIVVYKQQEIITYCNNIQKDKISIKSKIAMRGAEHRKNRSKSKSDKHQKGLKQRVTQKKNAEQRIINHQFAFTSNIEIDYLDNTK